MKSPQTDKRVFRVLLFPMLIGTFYLGLSHFQVNFGQFLPVSVGKRLEFFFQILYASAGIGLTAVLSRELYWVINQGDDQGFLRSIPKLLMSTFVNCLWFSFIVMVNIGFIAPVFVENPIPSSAFSFSEFGDLLNGIFASHLNALSFDFVEIVGQNRNLGNLNSSIAWASWLYWFFYLNIQIIFVEFIYRILRR